MHSAAAFATTRYSASALDRETVGWRLEDHDTRESLRYTQNPDVDHLVSGQPPQSASEYAVMLKSGEARRSRSCDVVLRMYRRTRLRSAR